MDESQIRLLLVDDEAIILTLFKSALQAWGYTVDIAEDGKKALQLCNENNYHIMITDLNMPNMDGMALLKRVKSRWPMMEVIVVTGYGTIETAIEAMKMGASDFILKPVNFEQVQFTIKKCYQKIKAESENQELREINAQLRSVNEMKDKFLAITNHEIRTPLTIIKGYLEILEMIMESDDPEIAETIDIIRRTTLDLNSTVERMHALSRANQITWQGRKESVDLKEFLIKIREDMSGLFKHRNITLTVQTPEKQQFVMGTTPSIRIILQELLQNALKFTPDEGKVIVSVKEKDEHFVISVQDTGIGIPYEKQDLIFSDFYEVQDTINHKTSKAEFMGGGMGIGLSLVKEVVTSLRGQIELESEPNVGSTFKVYLQKATLPEMQD
ncbi:MAG: response regulator [Calditrichaeota bacterium]|nr:response regulator [Calditrichota bacterium]MCB0286812.1 response regulator [Calditrichota bacterium]MCB9067553.1 response regulator [Calditrichia bacterium]